MFEDWMRNKRNNASKLFLAMRTEKFNKKFSFQFNLSLNVVPEDVVHLYLVVSQSLSENCLTYDYFCAP